MKRYFIGMIVLLAAGCSYLDNPGKIWTDQHYAAYQERLDMLESRYLADEITYAQYMMKKKEIDDQYSKEVQDRVDAIEGVR